ncbi:MAG: DUF547 domain-containing protein [Proteobacteria bacterium]|jgi:hypothetical protein|nr:DUF547 domain-containing protein [Pseudomonadota bacterium]
MIKLPLTLILLIFCAQQTTLALEQAIPIFATSNESNDTDIDHTTWQNFLSETVITTHKSAVNRLNYSLVSPKQALLLAEYIAQMSRIDPRQYSRKTQFAYWVNSYNALTISLILEHYPIDSIREIKSGLFSFGPWGKEVHEVTGFDLSLDDIEHKILRPIWKDSRVHYAVNCASVGCPNLQPHAFTADNSEKLLNLAAQQYVNHPRGVAIENGELKISSIYHWYKEDFGDDINGIVKHLIEHADPPLSELLKQPFYRYDHAYDWSLNKP